MLPSIEASGQCTHPSWATHPKEDPVLINADVAGRNSAFTPNRGVSNLATPMVETRNGLLANSCCFQGCPQIAGYALTDWEPSIQIQLEAILHIQSAGHSRPSEGFLIGCGRS
jgi:hypothetical protein